MIVNPAIPAGAVIEKAANINVRLMMIFTLGSKSWMMDSAG
jgi:hypothetical protein